MCALCMCACSPHRSSCSRAPACLQVGRTAQARPSGEAPAEAAAKKPNPKSRKGGEGPSQAIRTANTLASLKARKAGNIKKLPGHGKSKAKLKARAAVKAAKGKK